MTISKVIALVNDIKPNQYTDQQKINWINYLDASVVNDIFSQYEECAVTEFVPYTNTDADKEKELLVPFPNDIIYEYYLKMKIDEANEEMGKYNNNAMIFNAAFSEYSKQYNREHKHKSNISLSY